MSGGWMGRSHALTREEQVARDLAWHNDPEKICSTTCASCLSSATFLGDQTAGVSNPAAVTIEETNHDRR